MRITNDATAHACLQDTRNTRLSDFFRSGLGISLICGFLMSGCSSFQKDTSFNLERQIQRQQAAREMKMKPSSNEEHTARDYENMGDRYMLRKDINRAYLNYMRGLEIEPESVSLLEKQASLLLAKNKYFEAGIVYQKLLNINSANSEALEGQGRAYFGLGKLNEAEDNFRAALAISPNRWKTHEYLGLIASQQQDLKRAIACFEQALELQPENDGYINNLAVSYYIDGDIDEALRLLSELAKSSRTRKVHNNLALVYFKLGYYEEAMASFKRGSESEAEAYNSIGYQFLVSKQFVRAIEAFERAIDLNPKYYIAADKNLTIARKEFTGNIQNRM
ncbi:tetratricopeptide repeat protein [Desulfosediminicola flagellatus]|uniref:tetratricopeptide repeat protein n=1 Tax=Desulfosediminicola flagellatus TaxID=2569541 RepID=UPI0010AB8359|nr:tetratricopeptide repeat protein [Desulfosediminicola flagellatus]